MNVIYVILGSAVFIITCEIIPVLIFDLDYLFPIIVREGEININTVIIYSIFTGAAYSSWDTFQYKSWKNFIFFWITVSIIAFGAELAVEQIRWNLQTNIYEWIKANTHLHKSLLPSDTYIAASI